MKIKIQGYPNDESRVAFFNHLDIKNDHLV